MSDLAATNCGCGEERCGCGGGCGSPFSGNSCNCAIWIIILMMLCGNNGCGSSFGGGSDNCCLIIILLLLCCGCGGNTFGGGCGCGC